MIPIKLIESTWPPAPGQYHGAIVLFYDDWNDYGYRTTFGMRYCSANGNVHIIGNVKILRDNNDDSGGSYFVHTREYLGDSIDYLPENFCSLGQDLKYYQNLKLHLPDEYKDVLKRLNDIAVYDDIREKICDIEGISMSLLRFSGAEKAQKEAKENLGISLIKEKDLSFEYTARVKYSDDANILKFNFRKNSTLPYRINVLIGKNGTGKTQILTNLASDLSGYADEAVEGETFPKGRPAFDKVMSISYSAFDSFKRPEFEDNEGDNVSDNSRSVFSYVYCGIQSENGTLKLNELQNNLKAAYMLVDWLGRVEIWSRVLSELLEAEHTDVISKIMNNDFSSINLSSGQHILICTITELVAYIENESIILFDEPEIHLHPNAVANMMRMFNMLLEHFDSYAIFSTHSPLILQEVPSEYITVLSRNENILTARKPDTECFGNNVSDIIFDAFDVSNEESNYKSILKKLSESLSFEEICQIFGNNLSFNALMYLKNCYNSEEIG